MVKLKSDCWEHSDAYRQALEDFGITQLLSRIDKYRDDDFDAMRMALQKQEVESIANLLIEQLIANLKGSVLANYLYVVRNRTIHRPWAIARILPGAKASIIASFVNRQDADDRLRALQRYIPNAVFEIVFCTPES